MIMKGQKRKFPAEDVGVSDRSCLTWENQRQFVFSVSLSKYQRGQELPEPSLRRSVLIANTLRQISLEACWAPSEDREVSLCSSPPSIQEKEWEGVFTGASTAKHHSGLVATDSPSVPAICPLDGSSNGSHCVTSRCPASFHVNTLNAPLSVGEEDEDWGLMSTDPDFSLSAAVSSILTALDSTIDGSPQVAPRTPLRSLENLTKPSEGSASWVKQEGRGYAGSWEQQEECRVRETNMEVMRSSYLSDITVEDLFHDIDTSLLERDMGVLGLRGHGGGYLAGDDVHCLPSFPPSSSSSHPFSLSFNQNLKCLPSFSSFSPLSTSSSSSSLALSSPTSSPFPGHNHVREGLELEHLMEILVES